MQALILAGGEGTRLRPLTSTVPKPVVPLVDRPFIVFMLEWLRSHGVDDVVMSCGHLASGVRNVLGDGSAFGVRLRYMEEPRPLGTGGALKLAEPLLDERFLMLNGDVLSDIDLDGADAHARGARRARDARARAGRRPARRTGSCASRPTARVTEFLEKPAPDQIDTNNISAGRLRARALGARPAGARHARLDRARRLPAARRQRALRPRRRTAYWLDIGTPERYLRGTFDILEGTVGTSVAERMGTTYLCVARDVENAGRIVPSALVESGCRIARGRAHRRPRGARDAASRSARARCVERSVVMQGTEIGAHCTLRGCIVAGGVRIGDHTHVEGMAVIGEGATIGAHNVIANGARVFPGVELPDGNALQFWTRHGPWPSRTSRRAGATAPGRSAEMLDLAVHLRDALWRVDSAGLAPRRRAGRPGGRRHGRVGGRRLASPSRRSGPPRPADR